MTNKKVISDEEFKKEQIKNHAKQLVNVIVHIMDDHPKLYDTNTMQKLGFYGSGHLVACLEQSINALVMLDFKDQKEVIRDCIEKLQNCYDYIVFRVRGNNDAKAYEAIAKGLSILINRL